MFAEMTYAQFLLIFLVPPIVALVWLQWRSLSRMAWSYVGFWALVAFLYTPIWDNYLVANDVWWYPDNRVLFTIGYVPIEEYTFFILQPIMMGLWIHLLTRYLPAPQQPLRDKPKLRLQLMAAVGVVWVLSVIGLIWGGESLTYLTLILAWALPPIMLQLFFGADILLYRWRLTLAAIITGTTYLSLADAVAIHLNIWTISPAKSLEIYLGGVLPIEEAIFFFITNVLITFATVFVVAPQSMERARRWVALRPFGGRRDEVQVR